MLPGPNGQPGLHWPVHCSCCSDWNMVDDPGGLRASDAVDEDVDEASDLSLMAQFLSDQTLVDITGCSDLASVRRLEIQVDSEDLLIRDLGDRLPNLVELKMNGSSVVSFRDLGITLRNVRVLWLSRSGVQSLDGIAALPSLQELYLSFNDISELRGLSDCEQLSSVDLEGNNVADMNEVECLQSVVALRSLTLLGNPIAAQEGYREQVLGMLPELEMLDDEPRALRAAGSDGVRAGDVAADSVSSPSGGDRSDSDWGSFPWERGGVALGDSDEQGGGGGAQKHPGELAGYGDATEGLMVQEGIKHAKAGLDELSFMSLFSPGNHSSRPHTQSSAASRRTTGTQTNGAGVWASRPSTACILSRPMSATPTKRPQTALLSSPSPRPSSADRSWYFSRKWVAQEGGARDSPSSVHSRRHSGHGEGESAAAASEHDLIDDETPGESASDLTYGTDVVFCGSMTRALRDHKVETSVRNHVQRMEKAQAAGCLDLECTPAEMCGPVGKDELLDELRKWKIDSAAKLLQAENRWHDREEGGGGWVVGDLIGTGSCDRLVLDDD